MVLNYSSCLGTLTDEVFGSETPIEGLRTNIRWVEFEGVHRLELFARGNGSAVVVYSRNNLVVHDLEDQARELSRDIINKPGVGRAYIDYLSGGRFLVDFPIKDESDLKIVGERLREIVKI